MSAASQLRSENATQDNIKYVGRIPGRYVLPQHVSKSGVSVFACITQSISVREIVLAAPIPGSTGAAVSANLDEIGLVKGEVGRIVQGGFALCIDPKRNDLNKLSSRIRWVKRRFTSQVADNRSHKRFMPRQPHAKLTLVDGDVINCFVIDASVSGVAVSADVRPELGALLVIGSIVGRVVRYLDAGFALQFIESVEPTELEGRLAEGN